MLTFDEWSLGVELSFWIVYFWLAPYLPVVHIRPNDDGDMYVFLIVSAA